MCGKSRRLWKATLVMVRLGLAVKSGSGTVRRDVIWHVGLGE